MIIKVCGMTDAENIAEVAAAGADWIGLIFYPPSPRFVSQTHVISGTIPDSGRIYELPTGKKRIGVFVDDTSQNIITRVVNFGLDMIQFHGNETPTMICNLRHTIADGICPDIKIIKAISITRPDDMEKAVKYEAYADYLLFDTKCPTAGGSGRKFDWTILESYNGKLPFIISGGIGPGDEESIVSIKHPMLAGVDLNSLFETSPGIKDATRIQQFIKRLKMLTE